MTTHKKGVLITNVGTPDAPTPSAVRRYLREFLSDRRVVEIPRLIWWPILYGVILPLRPKQSAKLYQKIWTETGSPLLVFSQQIKKALHEQLALPVALGMHYGNPSIETALDELRQQSVTEIIVLPLFPQYSATTTGASFDLIAATLKKWRNLPTLHFIRQYALNSDYITALKESVLAAWQTQGRAEHLLFSFHGIPKRFVDLGDTYPLACYATAGALANALGLQETEWSLSFQSRLGRAEWLTPYTDKTLQALAQRGVKKLQVICPGFAADCLETLEEIAIQGKKIFLSHGGDQFHYIPALNDSARHIDALCKIIYSHHDKVL